MENLGTDLNKIVTDVNEDKWSRTLFPQTNNNSIKSISKLCDDKLDEYLADTKAATNIPQSTTFDISRQNDQLNSFTDKIRREFEQIQKTKRFPSAAYRFPVSNDPLATNFVANPEQISPLLKASEDRIKALQEEMSLREKDLLKMSGMISLLLEENKYLRDHIATKNKDMTKMLDTIGLNDGESVHSLRHRLNLLSEENNILLAHLEELKASKTNIMAMTQGKENDFAILMESYKECKENLEEALKREHALANFKHSMEPKFRQAQDKIFELEANVQDLMEELTQLKNKHLESTNQGTSFKKYNNQIDQFVYEIRRIQELENKNTGELDQLVFEVNSLKNEKAELRKLLDSQQKLDEERESEFKRVRKDFEGHRLENEELVQTVNQLKNLLANEKQAVETAEKKEADFKEKHRQIVLELEKIKANTAQTEFEQKRGMDNAVQEAEAKVQKLEQKLAKAKAKNTEIAAEKDEKIGYLELKLKEANRISSRLESERDEFYQKIQEQVVEKEDLLQKEKFRGGLEVRAESLERQLLSLKEERSNIEKRHSEETKILKEDIFRLNDVNRQLLEEVAQLKKKANERSTRASSMDFRNTMATQKQNIDQENVPLYSRATFEDQQGKEALAEARKSLNNVEQENEYLRLVLKNTVAAGEEEHQTRPRLRPSIKERPTSVSPSKKEIRRSHISYDIQNRPSHRSIVSGYRDIPLDNMSLSRIDMTPIVNPTPYNPRVRRNSEAETSALLNTSGVERVVSNVLKKYNMEKPPNVYGYKGLGETTGPYDFTRNPINKEGLELKDRNVNKLVLNKNNRRSVPMSPDHDHRDGKKSVIEEIVDDLGQDYI